MILKPKYIFSNYGSRTLWSSEILEVDTGGAVVEIFVEDVGYPIAVDRFVHGELQPFKVHRVHISSDKSIDYVCDELEYKDL